jgi:hypothetical protein
MHEGQRQSKRTAEYAGCRLNQRAVREGAVRQASLSARPYWGKPAVRNDRGDGGNVGIIRSPLRATVLPDLSNLCRACWKKVGTDPLA